VASLDVLAVHERQRGGEGRSKVGSPGGQEVVQVVHGGAVRKLKAEYGSRCEPGQTAAKANPNDHAAAFDLTAAASGGKANVVAESRSTRSGAQPPDREIKLGSPHGPPDSSPSCNSVRDCDNRHDAHVEPGHPAAAHDSLSRSVNGARAVTRLPRAGRRPGPYLKSQRRGVFWTFVLVLAGICLVGAPPASAALLCHRGGATASVVGRPTSTAAWRAELLGPTGVYGGVTRAGTRAQVFVGPSQASWLLVLDAAHTNSGRCWLEVRLPWRPNDASGWIQASQVVLRPTPWRIVVSTADRSLSVNRRGHLVRRVPVVVGKPSTPSPEGLFSIIGAWADPPNAFLGSWILPLTAHSDILQQFDGGDGTVGIHGRGGASLLDPLGSAASHGCIRVDNSSIDWLVGSIGVGALPGVPVQVE